LISSQIAFARMDTTQSSRKRGRSNSPHSDADEEKAQVSQDNNHDEEGAVDNLEQRANRDVESEDELDEDSMHKRTKYSSSSHNESEHDTKELSTSTEDKDANSKPASDEEPSNAVASSSSTRRDEEAEHREAEEKAGDVENDQDDVPLMNCPTYNIFVANLGREVTKEDLRNTYSVCGPIHSTTIVRDKKTGQSKNFGFVHFLTPEARDKALETMRGVDIKGRVAKAYTAENKNILFIGNIPAKMSESELKAALEDKGKFPIASLRLAKGFCFVTYINFHMAEKALKNLSGQVLENRRLTVEPAKNKKLASPDGRSSPGKVDPPSTLFIRNIPNELTEEELKKHFDPFGRIAEARIVKDPQTGKNKGFAFVEFGSASSAENAKRELADLDLGGRRIVIEFAQSAGSKKAARDASGGGFRDGGRDFGGNRRFFPGGGGSRGNSFDLGGRRDDRDSGRGHSRPSVPGMLDPRAFGLPMLPPMGAARIRGDDYRGGPRVVGGMLGGDRGAVIPPFQMMDSFGMPVGAMPVAWDEYSGQLVLLTPQQHAALQQQYGRSMRGDGDRDRDRGRDRDKDSRGRDRDDRDDSARDKSSDRLRGRSDDDRTREREKYRGEKRDNASSRSRDRDLSPPRERDRSRERDRGARDDRISRSSDNFAFAMAVPGSMGGRHRGGDDRQGRPRTHNPY